ncbi:MAG: aminopeptidase N [Alphaproteobacteria bacterium]|jgi:aminopeptidase N
MSPAPKTVYSKDYKKPDYQISHVDMTFDLDSEKTKATAEMKIQRAPDTPENAPMWLDGEELTLTGIAVNGKPLSEKEYILTEEGLELLNPPRDFVLTIKTDLNPKANTKLQGLYESDGILCTKCETHGFRRITFFPDRPDVMPTWRTTLIGDSEKLPVLISNGNREASEELPDGRRKEVFFDPVPKACYLYAVVGGKLDRTQDKFVTRSGREVDLNVFVEKGKGSMSAYALDSLKRAMKWDEETFGREYDHDVFNIVAVSNFNSGACENTSLNIFNDKYVLADPQKATDADYANIEGVVAHEYFHNWSGNRVTLRDWFDLTLKEGLTVYRDQEFSSDQRSRAVKRIEDVSSLRAGQFPQDAGPLAHPIRPDSYISVRSLYTGTVYNKGAEVIRMMERMAGREKFRRGMDIYFERNDGKAVTCDDFVKAIEDGSGLDLRQFRNWYHQAGTPVVTAEGAYDEKNRTYALTLKQQTLPTPGQPIKKPFVIPLEIGLLDKDGRDMPLTLSDEKKQGPSSRVLVLNAPEQTFVFKDIREKPVLSGNRGFTSPVYFRAAYTPEERALLMAKDSDLFNRWEAGQQFAADIMLDMVRDIQENRPVYVPPAFTEALKGYLNDETLDRAFIARAFQLPTEKTLAERSETIDVDAIHQARTTLQKHIATELKDDFERAYAANRTEGPYIPNAEESGKRAVKNTALSYLSFFDDSLALKQYTEAAQMTDKDAAVRVFAGKDTPEARAVMADFYETYRKDSLVVDKWLTMQATAAQPDTLARVKELMHHESFSLRNPNKVRALLGAFTNNPTVFHAKDGSGYDFIAEQTLAVDKINPQVAATLPVALGNWKKFDPERQEKMKAALNKIISEPGLSPNTYEIVSKSLDMTEKKKEPQKASSFFRDETVKKFSNGAQSMPRASLAVISKKMFER